jgi:hypothetical protein
MSGPVWIIDALFIVAETNRNPHQGQEDEDAEQ